MSSPILHIVKPNVATPVSSAPVGPVKVVIQAPALMQLIDAVYMDNEENLTQSRTIGTLLGTRSDDGSELEIKECFIVPHKEEADQLTIEESYHISTYQLLRRVNPELLIVGWFSTNPVLDSFTGLFQEFYSKSSCFPHQPIHLTLQSKDDNGDIISPILKTYISSPVGLPSGSSLVNQLGIDKIGSYAFTPVPNEIAYSNSELNTLKYLNKGVKSDSRTVDLTGHDELKQILASVSDVSSLLDTLKAYVDKVTAGEIQGDQNVGKSLLESLNTQPSSIDPAQMQIMLQNHIDDASLVEYLASCVKQQLDLSAKLTNFMTPEESAK
ncbi:hypothetical protein OGAPHI_001166 [Ogataea philodendri]|uniref:MPN domain-containing protein n=1 Tax=Ogataea philodendri TaxID=1378263 RepID=A0A9P8T999_9ASCO|nr:uncharacterized protein OGAPHI_001166 [Ogataea philodendri]KAH3670651.1 hypothetical protein OGAPHI_001166 [Ogataea philodendri]